MDVVYCGSPWVCRVGFLFTYISPLAFVLAVTILKEAYDDFKRYKRDQEANSQRYEVLDPRGTLTIHRTGFVLPSCSGLLDDDRTGCITVRH